MPSLREKFGQRIKTIRVERELSQEQFAELLEISVDFLSLIERGINAPSFENLKVFSTQLGVPVFYLFTFDEGPQAIACRKANRCLSANDQLLHYPCSPLVLRGAFRLSSPPRVNATGKPYVFIWDKAGR